MIIDADKMTSIMAMNMKLSDDMCKCTGISKEEYNKIQSKGIETSLTICQKISNYLGCQIKDIVKDGDPDE